MSRRLHGPRPARAALDRHCCPGALPAPGDAHELRPAALAHPAPEAV